ncbi:hypothetical protein FSARC_3553 [Fusarium sarcochroum]|uniref:Berberine/berberine-like domain-containing protein n=1 Tax=Fusarium sarcochroum TaxID=1208366 RepID=A0A8H4U3T6_9HYPO|nr:hypothetical protein FSARC_3553 [Fusarium sarcochroum]
MELSLMNEVSLNEKQDTVSANESALRFHVYKKLVSNRMDGYVVNGGRYPTVGEFSIVTADGDEVIVSDRDSFKSDKGKLFWALRGASGGNFGVVVEMKLAVKELRSKFIFYIKDWHNGMTIDSTWLCELGDEKSQWIKETKKSLPTDQTYQIYTSFEFQNDPEKIRSITNAIREEFKRFRKEFKGDKGSLQKEANKESYYGKNHLKLRQVKKIWDKDNYFKWQQGISLPAQAQAADDDTDDDKKALSYLIAKNELVVTEEILTEAWAEQQWESFYRFAMTELDSFGGAGLPTLVTV